MLYSFREGIGGIISGDGLRAGERAFLFPDKLVMANQCLKRSILQLYCLYREAHSACFRPFEM